MAMTSKKPFRILIIDDSEIVREALAGLIETEPDMVICGEASDGKTALKLAQNSGPDIIILDLSLDDWKGEEVLKKLRELVSCPVLIVSMHDEMIHGVRTLKAGASGYLMKRDAADQIIPAIRKVLCGNTYISKSLAAQLGRAAHS